MLSTIPHFNTEDEHSRLNSKNTQGATVEELYSSPWRHTKTTQGDWYQGKLHRDDRFKPIYSSYITNCFTVFGRAIMQLALFRACINVTKALAKESF